VAEGDTRDNKNILYGATSVDTRESTDPAIHLVGKPGRRCLTQRGKPTQGEEVGEAWNGAGNRHFKGAFEEPATSQRKRAGRNKVRATEESVRVIGGANAGMPGFDDVSQGARSRGKGGINLKIVRMQAEVQKRRQIGRGS